MKKVLTIAFVLAAIAATAVIIYLNKKGPAGVGFTGPSSSELDTKDLSQEQPLGESTRKPAQQSWPRPEFKNIDEQKKQKINSYLENSRFNQAIQFIEKELSPMFEGMLSDPSLSEAEKEGIRNFLERMKADSLGEEYRQILNEKFSDEELSRLDDIYQDSSVQEFMAEQQDMMLPGSEESYFKFLDKFDADKLPKDRRSALDELSEVQMKMLPKDMFGGEGMGEFASILDEARQEIIGRVAFAGRNMSTEQIRNLAKRFSEPVALGAGQEQIKMIMNITKQSIEAMSNQSGQ